MQGIDKTTLYRKILILSTVILVFTAKVLLLVNRPALVSQRLGGTIILQLNWLIVPSIVILPITGTVASGLGLFFLR